STTDPGVAYELEAACSLSPAGISDPARLVQLADIWLKAGLKEPWRMIHVGLAHYRAGKFKETVRDLEGVDHHWAYMVRAMAHHRLGSADEAKRWLAKADTWYNGWIEGVLAATPLPLDYESVWSPLLWREAKAVVEGAAPADPRLRLVRARGYTQLGQLKKA